MPFKFVLLVHFYYIEKVCLNLCKRFLSLTTSTNAFGINWKWGATHSISICSVVPLSISAILYTS